MGDWVMIGVPSSAGAHHAGQERAPDALRAGRAGRTAARGRGNPSSDAGDLPGACRSLSTVTILAARNLAAVVPGWRAR